MCVTTCPTGIDIRHGLQMECIGCAQCIDACDAVMDKISRPRGLIRYSSKASMEGDKFRILRPRVVLYPAILLLIATLFTLVLLNTGVADVTILRGLGLPFRATSGGMVENNVRVKITNRTEIPATFTLAISGVPGATIKAESPTITIAPGQMLTIPAQVFAPRTSFAFGRAAASITVAAVGGDDNQFTRSFPFSLLGPSGDSSAPKAAHSEDERRDEHHAEEKHE
jgi:polyferredoxin